MIQKSASKSKSVDFHTQFFGGCLYEQAGSHPISGNLCLNLKNHSLDECHRGSDSGKVHPRESQCSSRFHVQGDRVIQTEGTMNHQVLSIKLAIAGISQWWISWQQVESQTSMNVSCQSWETDALNISWKGLDGHVFCPVALVLQVMQR